MFHLFPILAVVLFAFLASLAITGLVLFLQYVNQFWIFPMSVARTPFQRRAEGNKFCYRFLLVMLFLCAQDLITQRYNFK